MAEKLNGYINIPYPLLMLLGTVFVACITWGITVAGTKRQDVTTAAAYYRQVDVNTTVINNEIKPDIQKLKDTKVDKSDYEWVRQSLERIEAKIDAHMTSSRVTANK